MRDPRVAPSQPCPGRSSSATGSPSSPLTRASSATSPLRIGAGPHARAFIALACMVPGLSFFLFDRQRLSTLRARFEQQVFRLDRRVTTLADVEARYGNQLDEMYGQNGGSATARLTSQGRWPIPLATVVLAFGWVLTLLPVKSDPPGLVGGRRPCPLPRRPTPWPSAPRRLLLRDQPHSPPLCPRRSPPQGLSAITGRVIVAVLLGWLVKVVADVPAAPASERP